MREILKLSANLYVDLSTGNCRRTKVPMFYGISRNLTKGQLMLLNHLVRNREVVCPTSTLEELLESDFGESKCPCIKGYISRIRKILKEVDATSIEENGKKVFQSLSGTGYIFHLPDGGEIIKEEEFEDTLIRVDCEYIMKQKVMFPTELENLKNVFYGITSDSKMIMKAICNGLAVGGNEYRILLSKLSSYIFKERNPAGPVFLMADAGAGKSTILCSLAVQTARDYPNWVVYYWDMEDMQNSEETFQKIRDCMYGKKKEKILLCIEIPHKNPVGFKEVYQQLLKEKELYIYTVIAERVSYMLNILESDKIYQRNSYICAVYIDSAKEREKIEGQLRISSVQFYDFKPIQFSQELKWNIANFIINYLKKRKNMDLNIIGKSFPCSGYLKETITDIFLNFERRYATTIGQCYIPKMEMDCDEWRMICKDLDKDCTRLKLSETFPYIAVCNMIGIEVSYNFIYQMTGYPYKCKLVKLFPRGLGESIQFYHENFRLRHGSVAWNFFLSHPEISPVICLENLIIQNYMDEETAFYFGLKVFDFYVCKNAFRKNYTEELRRLWVLFKNNVAYMHSIIAMNRAYVMEFAYILLKYNMESLKDEKDIVQEELSLSFLRVINTTSNIKVQVFYWKKYAEMVMRFDMNIPESLVRFAEDIELDKAILLAAIIHGIIKDIYLMREWSEVMTFCSLAERVCIKIIFQYPNSAYAYKTLAGIRLLQNRNREAKQLVKKVLYIEEKKEENSFLYKLFDIYNKELDRDLEVRLPNESVAMIIPALYDALEKQELSVRLNMNPEYYLHDIVRKSYPCGEDYTDEVIGILRDDLSIFPSYSNFERIYRLFD